MSYIIHIETSTNVCSVALSCDKEILFEKVSFEGPSHAALLGVFIEEVISILKEKEAKPDAVAISSGPGSYTGLRIGVSMAKGLCFGYNIPLIEIPTLEILASRAIRLNGNNPEYLYCAMLDARRMEVYSAVYDHTLKTIHTTKAEIIDNTSYQSLLEKQKICFFGNGSDKCKDLIQGENTFFMENIHPMATEMIELAKKKYDSENFVDSAYFEPFYLKDFIATVAKNKVLGNN